MPRKPSSPPGALILQGDLDLFSIQSQSDTIQMHLAAHGGAVTLDLSQVGDLDLSGLQLLLVLERRLSARGGRLSLAGVKAEWLDRFRPMGLSSLLEARP